MKYFLYEQEYFNSHGNEYTIKDFVYLEVKERKNYTLSEVKQWMKKYNLTYDTPCIWVTNKNKAYSYTQDSERFQDLFTDTELSNHVFAKYTNDEGYIIPESNDGDEGFLFIINKNI